MSTIADRYLELRAYDENGSGRSWTKPLHFEVDVEQTKRRRPNKATAKIYNLSQGSIAWLESEAEYLEIISSESLLYRGHIRRVETRVEEPDLYVEITCGDGGKAYRDATLSRSYSPGASSNTVLTDLASAMGMAIEELGTVDEVVLESGHFVAGKCRDALDEIVETIGAEWSIQDGIIQILGSDAPKSGGPLLKSGAGLVGSPERKKKGIALKALLRPELKPGRLFKLESRLITGWYRVTRTHHRASSKGDVWETEIEAKEP